MNAYELKQQEKADRYAELATKKHTTAQASLNQVTRERNMIPLGQPILVGHHSEHRHRNHLDSMNNRERRGWEELDKAQHYADKADRIEKNLETNAVISSDDPDAIKKLQTKLATLEDERWAWKEHNKKARREGTEQLPPYVLKNLAGNIRNVKERIKRLEARQGLQDSEKEVNGVRIVQDTEDNRIRLFFDGKPPADVRTKLKSNGFRFAYSTGAWQRMLNNAGIFAADNVVNSL